MYRRGAQRTHTQSSNGGSSSGRAELKPGKNQNGSPKGPCYMYVCVLQKSALASPGKYGLKERFPPQPSKNMVRTTSPATRNLSTLDVPGGDEISERHAGTFRVWALARTGGSHVRERRASLVSKSSRGRRWQHPVAQVCSMCVKIVRRASDLKSTSQAHVA